MGLPRMSRFLLGFGIQAAQTLSLFDSNRRDGAQMIYRRALAILAFAIVVVSVRAAETPQISLLILGKSDQTLSIVNPKTLAVVAQVPAGPDPHEVVASDDGRFAYVSNYGGGSFNTITVIDLVAQKALPVIDLCALRGPHGLDYAAGKLWFTAEGAKVVGSYDPATKTIDWVLGTGQDRTHMIYVFPGQNQIVTTNVSSATVTFIEKGTAPLADPAARLLVRLLLQTPPPAPHHLDGNRHPRGQRLGRLRRFRRRP